MPDKVINLGKFRGDKSSLFSGRPQGKNVREILNLDQHDSATDKIEFRIPSGTTSFNPSFFLGLFFPSIKKLGISEFTEKYTFYFEDDNLKVVDSLRLNIKDGIRNAKNTINKKIGFGAFLKKKSK
jgi:hypothetical protein